MKYFIYFYRDSYLMKYFYYFLFFIFQYFSSYLYQMNLFKNPYQIKRSHFDKNFSMFNLIYYLFYIINFIFPQTE
jgi:hypothetical protein